MQAWQLPQCALARRIQRQRQVGEDLAQEEPRAAHRARSDWCACRSSRARHCARAPSPAPARCRHTRGSRTGRCAAAAARRAWRARGAGSCDSRARARSATRSRARRRASTACAARAPRRPVVHARAITTRTRAGRELLRAAAHAHRGAACSASRRGSRRSSQRSRCRSSSGMSMPATPERAEAERAGARAQLALERVQVDRCLVPSWRHHACQYNDLMALPTPCTPPRRCARSMRTRSSELGIAGYTLMKRAGEAALRYLRTRWPMAHRIVIVCGGGNNGGDGYVLARFAQAAGLTVSGARARRRRSSCAAMRARRTRTSRPAGARSSPSPPSSSPPAR